MSFFLGIKAFKKLKGFEVNPFNINFFKSRQDYPWRVALQQSPLPFSLTRQR